MLKIAFIMILSNPECFVCYKYQSKSYKNIKTILLKAIVRAVMSLYHGVKTKVRVGSELFQVFLVQVCVHQGSVSSPLLFVIAVDVISENAREGLMNEIL